MNTPLQTMVELGQDAYVTHIIFSGLELRKNGMVDIKGVNDIIEEEVLKAKVRVLERLRGQ